MKVARVRFRRWCGTWEPLAAMLPMGMLRPVGVREDSRQLNLQRGRVPMRGRGADRLVVAVKPL